MMNSHSISNIVPHNLCVNEKRYSERSRFAKGGKNMGNMPMPNEQFVAMLNDVFLKIWKPFQKETELNKEDYARLLSIVDEIIDKYKNYTYTASNGEVKSYIEDYALDTMTIVMANEKEKIKEQQRLLDILNGVT